MNKSNKSSETQFNESLFIGMILTPQQPQQQQTDKSKQQPTQQPQPKHPQQQQQQPSQQPQHSQQQQPQQTDKSKHR